MSIEYDIYLSKHISTVRFGFDWICNRVPFEKLTDILKDLDLYEVQKTIDRHDVSKYSDLEYPAYDNYFYGEKTQAVKDAFDYAWLHHIHNNPHHWQHWVLIEDDFEKPKPLSMPDNYILEMICDWWSFSWSKHFENLANDSISGLYEIFDWYNDHKNKIIFHETTRKKVELLLLLLKDAIDAQNFADWPKDE